MGKKIATVSPILPCNTPGELSPVIPVEFPETAPKTLIVKRQPFTFNNTPSTLPTTAKDTKEVDAKNFPIIRGFV